MVDVAPNALSVSERVLGSLKRGRDPGNPDRICKDARMKLSISCLLLVALCHRADAKVHGQLVEYKQGDTVFEGYLAFDDAVKTKRPGILVVHAWMGLDDNAKKRADMLAGLGYVAFAADIYGKNIRPKDRDEAAKLAGKYKADRTLLRAHVNAAYAELVKNPKVDAGKTAAIGYCFGGTTVLELARSGTPVTGVVSFHGGLDSPTPADGKNIKAKLLVLHGGDDPFVPAADKRSWEEMKHFFGETMPAAAKPAK